MRPLFLRWALINALAATLFTALGVGFVGRVNGAPLAVAALTVVVAAAVSAYAGWLCWRADTVLDSPSAKAGGHAHRHREIVHDAEHVYFAVALCQLLGLVGAAVGFYLISTSGRSASASDAVHHIIAGLGAGLVATITGVLCSVVLAIEHHALVHALER
jgi:hypothetical protein